MTKKTVLLASVLAIFALSIASAKTYDIVLSTPTKAGSVQLKAGEYQLKVEGTKATFTQVDTTKSFTTDVKVDTTETKFSDTKVDSTKQGDTNVVKDIELGGSKTKLEFAY